jgi:flagellar basal-body rod protein FlgF
MNKQYTFAAVLLSLLLINNNAKANNISYIIAASQSNLLHTQDRIADMTANVNTTGFKAEQDIYATLQKRTTDGKKISFPIISKTTRDYSQGGIVATGRQLDIAINGRGYFMVDTPRGIRYTRAGNLKVNPEGVLVTKEDYSIVGPGGGQVELTENDVEINIKENGLVTAGTEERGQIGIFIFENEESLIREGEGYYRSTENPTSTEESKVVQGALEASNVNSVTAMTDLIEVSRKIEQANQLQSGYHDLQLNMIRTVLK